MSAVVVRSVAGGRARLTVPWLRAADIALAGIDLRQVAAVVELSRHTLRVVRQNYGLAIGVNLVPAGQPHPAPAPRAPRSADGGVAATVAGPPTLSAPSRSCIHQVESRSCRLGHTCSVHIAAEIPTPAPRPKRRKAPWLIALAAAAALGGLTYAFTGGEDTVEGFQERPMACSEAMYAMGWVLPDPASDQRCTELSGGLAGHTQSGTFRMARADARPWLASLDGERYQPDGAGSDSVVERKEGLALEILRPTGSLQASRVKVDVRWEGEDTAVVTFETFD